MTGTAFDSGAELGPRVRKIRLKILTLARRVSCSPSLVSQIERGVSAPSVGMLYALATELRTSLDFLFGVGREPPGPASTAHGDGLARPVPSPAAVPGGRTGGAGMLPPGHGIVQRAGTRRTIDLARGVRGERLTPGADDRVDFLEVVYEPQRHSTGARRALRHDGHEYGLVITGTLQARVGFESYQLGPGDSIAFDSAVPHEYGNTTGQEVRAVWAVVHAQPGRP